MEHTDKLLLLFFLLIHCRVKTVGSVQQWKNSKAMKNNLIANEEILILKDKLHIQYGTEEDTDTKATKTGSFKTLRKLLFPAYKSDQGNSVTGSANKIFDSFEYHWDTVGSGKSWGLVFVDHPNLERRLAAVERLLKQSSVLIMHDTEQLDGENKNVPRDFIESRGALWNGRSCFTDIYDSTNVVRISTLQLQVWTTIFRGDLDINGKIYDSIVKAFSEHFDDINDVARLYNKEGNVYGTHTRLLLVAAMMTSGDILELGAGDYSTTLLDDVLEEEKDGKRMMVTAESDKEWLNKFNHLSSSFHRLVLVSSSQNN